MNPELADKISPLTRFVGGAFHEPRSRGRQSAPPFAKQAAPTHVGGYEERFMVPMHGEDTKAASHAPCLRSGLSAERRHLSKRESAAPCRAAATPGIFRRVGNLIARMKKHPGYTEAIGQDLDIIGAEQAVDLNTLKPVLKPELQAGHPNILWKKQGMGGLEIHVDRGAGAFSFLALDTEPDYLDTAPLPAPGQTALWKYKAIYRLHDEQVGQWSDVVSIGVSG